MAEADTISATLEDYLEAILDLEREDRAPRVRDIASALSVHKSTVTAALKTLSEKKLINYSPYEITSLTAEGRRIAEGVSENHRIIRRFLTDVLKVDADTAEENACRMEHVINEEVLERFAAFAGRYGRQNSGKNEDR
jgi:DtxR family Mn-dependent transcriptional regulator